MSPYIRKSILSSMIRATLLKERCGNLLNLSVNSEDDKECDDYEMMNHHLPSSRNAENSQPFPVVNCPPEVVEDVRTGWSGALPPTGLSLRSTFQGH
ncbi:hypothetical protein RRG08_028420 [Elysia crispata]|uniref:Uncharacterized protein n=1 Tax=Elysia crispata TaxID=231223 RepID=A0AAE1A249_9GAST|nr:hypothetical protein RRG08_028420 [Elysia crispata]